MGVFDMRMIGSYFTTVQPMKGFVDKIKGPEGRDRVLSISVAHCFPYADVPELGSKMLVITDAQPEQAARLGRDLGIELIKMRGNTHPPYVPVEEAIDEALAAPGAPSSCPMAQTILGVVRRETPPLCCGRCWKKESGVPVWPACGIRSLCKSHWRPAMAFA